MFNNKLLKTIIQETENQLELLEDLNKKYNETSDRAKEEIKQLKTLEDIKDFLISFVSSQRELNQEVFLSILKNEHNKKD